MISSSGSMTVTEAALSGLAGVLAADALSAGVSAGAGEGLGWFVLCGLAASFGFVFMVFNSSPAAKCALISLLQNVVFKTRREESLKHVRDALYTKEALCCIRQPPDSFGINLCAECEAAYVTSSAVVSVSFVAESDCQPCATAPLAPSCACAIRV